MDASEQAIWREADRILDELLDLPAPERLPRLRQMPLAPALRARVTRLLAAHSERSGPLDTGLLRQFTAADITDGPAAELGGQRLGRWRLLEPVGRGGMAVVYRAESYEPPLDQQAAVKLLTLGALAQGGRERFLREQRLLARLRHPYIAPLYDAGVAADGTPWLAMALVDGERIDDWCERHAADLDVRLGLVLQVAEALAYAHRNLVIHRDIKPSNVLVDDDGHAHLLDFGIGALVEDESSERTATGLCALTPEYAAPEQFTGAAPTTTMDVYGLGALLYRLLGGRPPDRDAAGATPVPPSRAAARVTENAPPRPWAGQLRGDLDLIVMKAMAPEPERRYASIELLAADLRRWRSRRPILARAPSLGYRMRRFIARNRWGVIAAAALAMTVLGGVAATLWQARIAREEARHAREAAAESEAQLTYVDSLLELLVVPTNAPTQKRDVGALVRRVAERARQDLAGRDAPLARVENTLAGVAAYGGDYAQSVELARSALARRRTRFGDDAPETGEAMQTMSFALRQKNTPKDRVEALALAERATAILRRRAADTPQLVEALDHLALLQMERDDTAQALALTDEAQSICDRRVHGHPFCERPMFRRSDLQFRLGHFQEAIAGFGSLLELKRRRLGPDHASTLQVASLLGMSYSRSGDPAKAVPLLEQTLAQQRRIYDRPTEETLLTQQSLAEALSQAGDYPNALRQFDELIGQIRQVFGEDSAQMSYAYSSLGLAEYEMGRYREAGDDFQHGRAIYAAMFGADSTFAMANQLYYADTLRERGRAHEALPLQRQAQSAMERSLGADSLYVARGLSRLATTELAVGDARSALAHYDRAVALYRAQLPADNPLPATHAGYRADALLRLGRTDEARQAARAALAEIEAKARRHPLYYGLVLAPYTRAMCAGTPAAPECTDARRRAAAELRRADLAGHARRLLTAALDDSAVAARR